MFPLVADWRFGYVGHKSVRELTLCVTLKSKQQIKCEYSKYDPMKDPNS